MVKFSKSTSTSVEAGRSLLDCAKGTDPEDFWLHQLYLDLLKNNSDLLFCGTKEGGMILSVCVASATFCARLEREALQQTLSAENNGKTERSVAAKPTATLPPTWNDLRKQHSITQKEAAGYLRRDTKTVQRLVKANELRRSEKKRIICDERLRNQIRKVHGPHVLP
jgi:hypothetical protein